jgi:hypothetical protein
MDWGAHRFLLTAFFWLHYFFEKCVILDVLFRISVDYLFTTLKVTKQQRLFATFTPQINESLENETKLIKKTMI